MTDWPQTGDSIRVSGKDERFHAQLDLGSWGIYPKAYLDAAEFLVQAVASGANPDVIGYPLMYLWRHYLELMLKQLIALGRQLDSNRDPSGYPDTHSLSDLWVEVRPLIAKYSYEAGENQQDLEAVGAVVNEFARLDPSGETFRYPVTRFEKRTRQRRETIPIPLSLGLDQVAERMKCVAHFLAGVEDVIDELLKYRADEDSEAF